MNQFHYGSRFGLLTYKQKATTTSGGNKRGLLKCACGTETIARHSELASGKKASCRSCASDKGIAR